MSSRATETTGQKSTAAGSNSTQRPQQPGAKPSTAPSPTNRTTPPANTVAPKATKPSFSAAAAGAKAPVRTNSAPPEEHPSDHQKPSSHFIPTKTTHALPTGEHVSYRSALGVKPEEPKTKPATTVEQPKAVPSVSATAPEFQPKEEVPPQTTQPEYNPVDQTNQTTAQSDNINTTINNSTSEQVESATAATTGEQRDYSNRNNNRNSQNPRRSMPRSGSGSYGDSGSMNNRAPRNPQHQYQQQPQFNPQMNAQYMPQQQQQNMQQYYQQLQQQQQYWLVSAAMQAQSPQQFQMMLAQVYPAEYVAPLTSQYVQYRLLGQQWMQAQASQYPQQYAQPQYYQAGYQQYPSMYYPQQPTAAAVPSVGMTTPQPAAPIYAGSPKVTQQPEDPTLAPPITTPTTTPAAIPAQPVYQSSPVVNTTPVTTGTPSRQTPTIPKAVEPEVPPPALQMPPQKQEEVKPPIPQPQRTKLKITDKSGRQWDPTTVVAATKTGSGTPTATTGGSTNMIAAKDESLSTETPAGDNTTKIDSKTVEEPVVSTVSTTSVPPVEEPVNALPDLPVSVARSKKSRAPTIDESAPSSTKDQDQPSFPVESSQKKEDTTATTTTQTVTEDNKGSTATAPAVESSGRRLVSGSKLSYSHFGQPAAPKKVYTKAEILALRPEGAEFSKNLMGNVNVVSDGPGGGRDGGKGSQSSYGRGGGGRGGRNNASNADYPRGGGELTPNSTSGEGPGWSREALPPIQTTHKKGRGGPASPLPPPKKKEKEAIDALADEAIFILNQIVPKTFDLFCQKLLDLPLKNTAMLDRLVEIIFEKAIFDTAFVAMYADLCLQLKEKSNWTFFIVAKHEEEYFWVRDFAFPEEAAGPYYSRQDALAAFSNEEEIPAMKPSTISPSNIKQSEVMLYKNLLLKIVQKDGGEWFVTAVPEDQAPVEQRSQIMFTTDKEASKDAMTELSFRGRLAHSCEVEFTKSVKNENLFQGVDEEYRLLKEKRSTITPEQYEAQEADILERRSKIKSRMLANIRFVGELYKKKLLNTETMHDCITELLGTPPNWKPVYEEEDLELLCDLLSTVGETLETKTKKMKKDKTDYLKRFEQYFEKLKLLSKDKSLIARIRFRIESVIDLRSNNWVKRSGNAIASMASDVSSSQKEDPGAAGGRPVSQRGGGPGPAPSSSSQPPRILARDNSQNDRYGGGRSGSQRDSYDSRRGGGDVRDQDRYSNSNNNRGGGYYDDRDSGKGGRGGGSYRHDSKPSAGGGKSSSSSSAPVNTTSTTTLAAAEEEKLEFNQESIRRVVNVSVDEILSGVDISELRLMLKETSNVHTGYFIQVILNKYANSSNASQKEKLLAILDDQELAAWLVSYRSVVEKAIESFQPLQDLCDVQVDIKQAPESFAIVILRLMKLNVIQMDRILKLVEKWKPGNAELGFEQDEIDQVYNRFLNRLH